MKQFIFAHKKAALIAGFVLTLLLGGMGGAALRRKKHQKRTDLQKSKVLKQTLLLKKILYRNGSLSKGRLFFKWHFSYERV